MPKKPQLSARAVFEELTAAENSFAFTGMIKQADGQDDALMFARAGDCTAWIRLPLELIENIEYAASVACGDHTHPVVRLTMKIPDNIQAEAFGNLAKHFQRPPAAANAPRNEMAPVQPVGALSASPESALIAGRAFPGATPCYFDYGLMRWRCPPWS